MAGCWDARSHTSSHKHIPASRIPAHPVGVRLLSPDTHLVDADLLELLLGCGQRGWGGAGGHVLLVTAQGHIFLQTEGQGRGKCQGAVIATGLDAPPALRLCQTNPTGLGVSPYQEDQP